MGSRGELEERFVDHSLVGTGGRPVVEQCEQSVGDALSVSGANGALA